MKKYKKILITGTAGFIGFSLAKAIMDTYKGISIVGVDNFNEYYDPKIKHKRNNVLKKYPAYTFYKTDIADYDRFEKVLKKEKPDVIVHLAAQAGVRYSLKNPWAYGDSNYIGTLNVFEGAHRHGISKVLFASSSSVYGDNKKTPFSESDRTDNPLSIYAASKKANELLAHSYNHLYKMDMIGMRFFTVYGDYGRPDMALFKFVKNILRKKVIDVYNLGRMKRNFTHVDDIVSSIICLLKNANGFEIYNLGGGETVSLMEFIRLIEKHANVKAKMNMLPMQAGDVKTTMADMTKMSKHFGFKPKVSTDEGVGRFVKWFIKNKSWLFELDERS